MRRIFSIGLAVLLVFSVIVACSKGEEPAKEKEGKTTIQFWHSLSGVNGEYMDALIKRFNESQEKVEVVGTFQGTYDETSTKLQQALSANTAPDVTMIERAYVQNRRR